MLKKYQVRGLLEWNALIPAGRGFVRVAFTGGQMSTSGMSPAEFVTDNPALQHIIENSDHYHSGRIIKFQGTIDAPKVKKAQSSQSSQTKTPTTTNENLCDNPDPADNDQDGRKPDEYNNC